MRVFLLALFLLAALIGWLIRENYHKKRYKDLEKRFVSYLEMLEKKDSKPQKSTKKLT